MNATITTTPTGQVKRLGRLVAVALAGAVVLGGLGVGAASAAPINPTGGTGGVGPVVTVDQPDPTVTEFRVKGKRGGGSDAYCNALKDLYDQAVHNMDDALLRGDDELMNAAADLAGRIWGSITRNCTIIPWTTGVTPDAQAQVAPDIRVPAGKTVEFREAQPMTAPAA
jgi:hypothetical protein